MKSRQQSDDERLHYVLENYADTNNRRIYLAGEIDEQAAYRLIASLQVLDGKANAPITLVLNSCGGLCSEGWAIYDAIRFAQNEVFVVVFGQASSMGSAILQAGDRRLLSEESDFFIHDAASYGEHHLTVTDAKRLSDDLSRLQRRMNRVLSQRSGVELERIEAWCKSETVFEAREAVRLGFADEVLKISRRLEDARGK